MVRVDARLDQETVWLSLMQIAELFDRDKSVISRHLRSVYRTGELERTATVAKNATVQREGERDVARHIEFFNLDAILSVGYRVNSKRGIQFRIWATHVLREHLVRGYTLNERRLAERGLQEARDSLELLASTLQNQALVDDTGQAVLELIRGYADTWRLLLEYDEDRLVSPPGVRPAIGVLDLGTAVATITEFKRELIARNEVSALFGNPRTGDRELFLFRVSPEPIKTLSVSYDRTI